MIVSTVHLPQVYRVPLGDAQLQGLHCSTCLQVLIDAAENDVILVDVDERFRRDIALAVQSWPIKYRKKGEEILTWLARKHRFVPLVSPLPEGSIPTTECEMARLIATTRPDSWTLTPSACICSSDSSCVGVASRSVELADYAVSKLNRERRDAVELRLEHNQWTQAQFEQLVWLPLFRDAKRVKLSDKIVGEKADASGIAWNFRESLEWIFSQFVLHSNRKTSDKPFEVETQFARVRSTDEKRDIRLGVQRWESELTARHDFPIRVVWANGAIGHDRYLETEQVRVIVSRGFDLLSLPPAPPNRRRIRDVYMRTLRPPIEL